MKREILDELIQFLSTDPPQPLPNGQRERLLAALVAERKSQTYKPMQYYRLNKMWHSPDKHVHTVNASRPTPSAEKMRELIPEMQRELQPDEELRLYLGSRRLDIEQWMKESEK